MSKGWICMHRKMLEWEWYSDTNVVRLFLHCLLRAGHKEKKWRGISIPKGAFLTGRNSLAEETGLSPKQIRVALEKLKKTNEVAIKATNKYSIITVTKWEDYQDKGQQKDQQGANEGPAEGQQGATNNNINNITIDTDSNARETISAISSLQVLEMHPLGGKHAEWWRKHCPDIDIKTVRDELVRKHRANGETLFDYWPELQNWGTFRQRKHNERPKAVSAATEGLFG